MGVVVVGPLAERYGGDDAEERGDDRRAEQRTTAESGVRDADRGAADGAPEAAPDSDDPGDGETVVPVEHGPGHDTVGEAVAVHAHEREVGPSAAPAEWSAVINVGRDGEVGWREERAWSIHGMRLVTTAWRADVAVQSPRPPST